MVGKPGFFLKRYKGVAGTKGFSLFAKLEGGPRPYFD